MTSILSNDIARQTIVARQCADALAESLSALADLHYQGGEYPLFRASDETAVAVVGILSRLRVPLDRIDRIMLS